MQILNSMRDDISKLEDAFAKVPQIVMPEKPSKVQAQQKSLVHQNNDIQQMIEKARKQ
jgi:hypothetical protein